MIGQQSKSKFERSYFQAYSSRGLYTYPKITEILRSHLVQQYVRSGTLLELGCAYGYLLAALEDGYECHGLDISEHAIEVARTKTSAKLDCGDLTAVLPTIPAQTFDGVVSFDVFEHVPENQLPGALDEVTRIMKPGGVLIASVPNTRCWSRLIKRSRWHGLRDVTHCSLLSPESWISIIGARLGLVRSFGDGLWDSPYVPVISRKIQSLAFAPTSIMAYWASSAFPRVLSENLIIVARKPSSRRG